MTEAPNFTCEHVTQVLISFSFLLERVADVQNSMAMESTDELSIVLSKALYATVKRGCDDLEEFLKDHDPQQNVTRPHLTLYPPARTL